MSAILNYIITLVFSIVTIILVLRLLMHAFKISSDAESSQFIAKLTNPILSPISKFLPRFPQLDLAALLVLLVVEFLKYIVLGLLYTGSTFGLLQILILVPADIVMQICWALFYIILFDVILSWVAPQLESPAISFLHSMSKPPVNLARKLISASSGFDFAPWVALVVLKIIQLAITSYIPPGYFF